MFNKRSSEKQQEYERYKAYAELFANDGQFLEAIANYKLALNELGNSTVKRELADELLNFAEKIFKSTLVQAKSESSSESDNFTSYSSDDDVKSTKPVKRT